MNIAIIGAGGWGTALALIAAERGHHVTLWTRSSERAIDLNTHRENTAYLPGIAIAPDIHIFNLETGYQFPETLELRERLKEKYGIEVVWVRSEESVLEMENRFGGPIYSTRPDECCRIRKVEPLRRAVKGWSAWISAIRRDQTPDRANSGIVEWDSKFDLVKVNPLANWSKKDVWDYILANNVPYNPLHDKGYPSIGCWPCTKAIGAGEDDRAGRWAGSNRTECGLHSK